MSAGSKLEIFAKVSLHPHYICNLISQTALHMVDNVKFLGVGVEQGQEFQRHKGVSFCMITLKNFKIISRIMWRILKIKVTVETGNLLEGGGQKWRSCQRTRGTTA